MDIEQRNHVTKEDIEFFKEVVKDGLELFRASVFPSVKWRGSGHIFLSILPLAFPWEQTVWSSKARVALIKWHGLLNTPG